MIRNKDFTSKRLWAVIIPLVLLLACVFILKGGDNVEGLPLHGISAGIIGFVAFTLFIALVVNIISIAGQPKTSYPQTKKHLENMPLPIISYPYKYAIVHLEGTYWIIDYFETLEEAWDKFHKYQEEWKLDLRVFVKSLSSESNMYFNKELHW